MVDHCYRCGEKVDQGIGIGIGKAKFSHQKVMSCMNCIQYSPYLRKMAEEMGIEYPISS